MNVLTNLMALLTPKTGKDGAQTPAAGQAGGADFAALMGMPTADAAAAATMQGAVIAPQVAAQGAADMALDADGAGALPLPQQTAAVLAQQIAMPVAGAKAIRNATVSVDMNPAGGKALPVVDGDPAEGESNGKGDGESEGVATAALPMPAVPDMQAAAVANSAAAQPLAPQATVPAPLPKQDKGRAPVAGVGTVEATANRAIPTNGSENIADIDQGKSASSGGFAAASASPGAQADAEARAGADALAGIDPKAARRSTPSNGALRGGDMAKASPDTGAASPLPNPAAQNVAAQHPAGQNPAIAQATAIPPAAMPSRLAGRASVTAARAGGLDAPQAAAQPAAQPAVDISAAIPQAIMQAVGGQPATVVAQAAAQGGQPSPAAQAIAAPAAETDAPVIGEATALLRMAAAAPAGKRGATPGVPALDISKAAAKATRVSQADAAPSAADAHGADLPMNADRPVPTVHAMQASLASAFPTVPAGTQPVTDLSATLGQQVIDMSSGGQWIDGLAKEIATLASGTGQGSFRLSPEHLGPMRVDIRQGDLGAEISLTVQTAAAESALRQDSDALKNDAQLSAVRVHEVRVERVHTVAETARSDTASNQNNGNNGGASSWNQGGTQAAFSQSQGQAQANAQGQGNGQQGGRKVSGGDAVLNHAGPSDQRTDEAQDGVRRARYA